MKRYLLDVYAETNEVLVNKLVRRPDRETEDELSRMEWQIHHAGEDVLLSNLQAVAVYRPSMEAIDKYEDGIAYYEGEELVNKIQTLLDAAYTKQHWFAGWGIKTHAVPILFRAFLLAGLSVDSIFNAFDMYPYEDKKTIDLNNAFNFNGQMNTVRARNRYSLSETCIAYGLDTDLEDMKEFCTAEEILRERIRLQKYLFNLRGYSWGD